MLGHIRDNEISFKDIIEITIHQYRSMRKKALKARSGILQISMEENFKENRTLVWRFQNCRKSYTLSLSSLIANIQGPFPFTFWYNVDRLIPCWSKLYNSVQLEVSLSRTGKCGRNYRQEKWIKKMHSSRNPLRFELWIFDPEATYRVRQRLRKDGISVRPSI